MSKGQADRGKTNQWPLPWTIIWCFIALKHQANHNFVYARNAHRVYDCLFVNTQYIIIANLEFQTEQLVHQALPK